MSFPVLDDRTYLGSTYWNELGYLFQNNMGVPPNSPLEQVDWSYNAYSDLMVFSAPAWLYYNHKANQPKGYKVQYNSSIGLAPVIVDGFKADAKTTPALWVRMINGQTQLFHNWIGYFVPFSQAAGDAFSLTLPESSSTYLDYVYTMKTQYWSTSRVSEEFGSRWIADPNKYTLSEGQMVVMTLLRDAPREMYWNASSIPTQRVEKPLATAFSYEEMLDYTPVFIEFDPEDMPNEVGLYISGECKGAAVVDSTIIDVCFYYETAKDGGDLELMFYYEGKGKKAAKGWKLYNQDRMVFEESPLKVDQIGDYAYLSFKRQDGDSPVPLVTTLQPN